MGVNVAVKTNHALGLQMLHGNKMVQLNDNKYKQILNENGFSRLVSEFFGG